MRLCRVKGQASELGVTLLRPKLGAVRGDCERSGHMNNSARDRFSSLRPTMARARASENPIRNPIGTPTKKTVKEVWWHNLKHYGQARRG